jgi:Ca-activated chloride channel family protein
MVNSCSPRGVAFCCLLLLSIGCLSPSVRAQSWDDVHVIPRAEAGTPAADPDLTAHSKPLRVGVDVVLVPVTVTDSMNRPVIGLGKQDFAVFENDEPREVRYFSTEDAPISIGILLDVSRSMTDKIGEAREAVGEFLKTSNPEDDFFAITFADRPELVAGPNDSIGTLQSKLGSVTPSGHTALLDAIYLGIAKSRRARYSRRALLIISDGGDNHSRYRRSEIRRLVQESDVEIYAIGIFDKVFKTPEEWAGKRLLTEITEATGGHTITLDNVRRLPEIAVQVSRELRSQYVIGYQPVNAAHDGKWRRIKVQLTAPGDPPHHVHCKKGYLGPES